MLGVCECGCECVGGWVWMCVGVMGGWKGRHTHVHAFLSAGFFPVLEESVGECCDHPHTQIHTCMHTRTGMHGCTHTTIHVIYCQTSGAQQSSHTGTHSATVTWRKMLSRTRTCMHITCHTHSCWSSLAKYWKYQLTWSLTSDSGCAIHFSWHSHTLSCLLKRIGKYEVEWTITDRNQKEFIAVGIACKAMIWPASGLKQ